MGIINFKYVDSQYLSTIVKNKDNGRQFIQVKCPSCGIVFDKRDFYEHVLKTHGKRRDEVLAKLFGIKGFPVICSDCGCEVHFDESTGIYSRKCRKCNETKPLDANTKLSLDQLLEKQRNLDEVYAANKAAIQEQIKATKREAEWKSLDVIEDTPNEIDSVSAKYMKKVVYELRTFITNSDKPKAYDLLNHLDKWLEENAWRGESDENQGGD